VIEPRIYRAAFLPTLLAVVLVAFSLEAPPAPPPQGLAADALFAGTLAENTIGQIVSTSPNRSPGSPGDFAIADQVKREFVAAGFPTTLDRFSQDGRGMLNVVGTRPGGSSKEIVVMAGRDSRTVPDAAGSAADTAALLEFARVFEGRASQHTLVLASVDGSALGNAGARRFLATMGDPSRVEDVIVLSDLGASRSRGPIVLDWANDSRRGSLGLERTVTSSLRQELGQVPHREGAFAQLARLAFPIAPGAEGELIDGGLDAVRLSGSGELPPGRSTLKDVDPARYGSLGRSVLRAVFALDAAGAPPKHGPKSYIEVAGKLVPGWALQLLALALMIPAFVASVDALARARRRREPIVRYTLWLVTSAVPFALASLMAQFFVLVGLAKDAPPAPLDPSSIKVGVGAACALIATALTAVLAWVLGRSRVIRRAGSLPDPTSAGAGCLTALVFSVLGLTMALTNPFAALVLAPAVHLWMLATLTDIRLRTRMTLAAIGLLPLVAVAVYYLWRLELGPVAGAYYLFLLVTGGQTGWLTALAGWVLLGIAGSVAAILFTRWRRGETAKPPDAKDEQRVPVFGPGGHAGPGALGGPQSVLRR
jgi:hypothetical protein